MGKALPEDLRWRAVFGVWWDGLSYQAVAEKLSMGPMIVEARWVKKMWELFLDTGDVQSRQGERAAPPANLIMDELAAWHLIDQLLSEPEFTLNEHHAEFQRETSTTIHISTFCRAVKSLGFSRQRVREAAAVASVPRASAPRTAPPDERVGACSLSARCRVAAVAAVRA